MPTLGPLIGSFTKDTGGTMRKSGIISKQKQMESCPETSYATLHNKQIKNNNDGTIQKSIKGSGDVGCNNNPRDSTAVTSQIKENKSLMAKGLSMEDLLMGEILSDDDTEDTDKINDSNDKGNAQQKDANVVVKRPQYRRGSSTGKTLHHIAISRGSYYAKNADSEEVKDNQSEEVEDPLDPEAATKVNPTSSSNRRNTLRLELIDKSEWDFDNASINSGLTGMNSASIQSPSHATNNKQAKAASLPTAPVPKPSDTTNSGNTTGLTEEEKKEKERFLMFTRVLMKYLEQRDLTMHVKAKAQIKECYEKNKTGDPHFRSLTSSMKNRLRQTVGETYWKKSHDYLDHFLKQKPDAAPVQAQAKKMPLAVGNSIMPVGRILPQHMMMMQAQSNNMPPAGGNVTLPDGRILTLEQKKAMDKQKAEEEAEKKRKRNAQARKKRAEQKKLKEKDKKSNSAVVFPRFAGLPTATQRIEQSPNMTKAEKKTPPKAAIKRATKAKHKAPATAVKTSKTVTKGNSVKKIKRRKTDDDDEEYTAVNKNIIPTTVKRISRRAVRSSKSYKDYSDNDESDHFEDFLPVKDTKNEDKKKAKKSPTPSQAHVEEELQSLSFDEQEALTESINLLPEGLLPGVMRIIRESGIVNDDDNEIDLDIDQLDTKIQRKLQKFVMQNIKTKKKKKQSKKTNALPANGEEGISKKKMRVSTEVEVNVGGTDEENNNKQVVVTGCGSTEVNGTYSERKDTNMSRIYGTYKLTKNLNLECQNNTNKSVFVKEGMWKGKQGAFVLTNLKSTSEYGWVITFHPDSGSLHLSSEAERGMRRIMLYRVLSHSSLPPENGWMAANGANPPPTLQLQSSVRNKGINKSDVIATSPSGKSCRSLPGLIAVAVPEGQRKQPPEKFAQSAAAAAKPSANGLNDGGSQSKNQNALKEDEGRKVRSDNPDSQARQHQNPDKKKNDLTTRKSSVDVSQEISSTVEHFPQAESPTMPWRNLWSQMRAAGWVYCAGDLVAWYWVHPSAAKMRKRDMIRDCTDGIHYFSSEKAIQQYAVANLGWKGEDGNIEFSPKLSSTSLVGSAKKRDQTNAALTSDDTSTSPSKKSRLSSTSKAAAAVPEGQRKHQQEKTAQAAAASKPSLSTAQNALDEGQKGQSDNHTRNAKHDAQPQPQELLQHQPQPLVVSSLVKLEDTDDEDDDSGKREHCYFEVVVAGKETDNMIRLPNKRDLTFADLRLEIEEDFKEDTSVPSESFKFMLSANGRCVTLAQEKKWSIWGYGLTKKGDGSYETPYSVFIKNAS